MKKIDIIASEMKTYISEDGFGVIPTKTVEDVNLQDYKCIILPGTINPLLAIYDDKLIDFL